MRRPSLRRARGGLARSGGRMRRAGLSRMRRSGLGLVLTWLAGLVRLRLARWGLPRLRRNRSRRGRVRACRRWLACHGLVGLLLRRCLPYLRSRGGLRSLRTRRLGPALPPGWLRRSGAWLARLARIGLRLVRGSLRRGGGWLLRPRPTHLGLGSAVLRTSFWPSWF
ncbi:hypothetical protein [Longimycelium tulufanense]|uniref:hypothetical protein n=1 Tax=Longimycelium tulufanense TaxID=907463 RepID=UPI00166E7C60|nr:hypothetical protein [Longimycelium tulufanense]